MNTDEQHVLNELGRAMIEGQWGDAARHLAAWVSADGLRTDFDAERTRVLDSFDHPTPPRATEQNVDGDELPLAELLETTTLPDEVGPDNYQGWRCIQYVFEPDRDDLEPAMDVWLALVRTPSGLAIGYYEFGEGD